MSKSVTETAQQINEDLSKAWSVNTPNLSIKTEGVRSQVNTGDCGDEITLVGERYQDGQDIYAHEVTHSILLENNQVYRQLLPEIEGIAKDILVKLDEGVLPVEDYMNIARSNIIRHSFAEMVSSFVGHQLYKPLDQKERDALIFNIEDQKIKLQVSLSNLKFSLDYKKFSEPEEIQRTKSQLFDSLEKELHNVVGQSHQLGQLLGFLLSGEELLSAAQLLKLNPSEMNWLFDSQKANTFVEKIKLLAREHVDTFE